MESVREVPLSRTVSMAISGGDDGSAALLAVVVLHKPQHLAGPRHNLRQGSRLHTMYLQVGKPYTGLGEMKVILQSWQPASSSDESKWVQFSKHNHKKLARALSPGNRGCRQPLDRRTAPRWASRSRQSAYSMLPRFGRS